MLASAFTLAAPQLQQLHDPTGSLSVNYVQRHLSDFSPAASPTMIGQGGDVLWLHFQHSAAAPYELVIRQPLLDRITLYAANGASQGFQLLSDLDRSQGDITRIALDGANGQQQYLLRLQSRSWGSVATKLTTTELLASFSNQQTMLLVASLTLLLLALIASAAMALAQRQLPMLWLCASLVLSAAWLIVNYSQLSSHYHWLPFSLLTVLLASYHGVVHNLSQTDNRSLSLLLLPVFTSIVMAALLPVFAPLARQVLITAGLAMFTLLWWMQLRPQKRTSQQLVWASCLSFAIGIIAWQLSTVFTSALSLWPLTLLCLTVVSSQLLLLASKVWQAYQQHLSQQRYQTSQHIKLRDEIERLRLINQSQNHFLATVSHEFRGPLNGILGSIENALSQPSHQRREELLDARSSAEEVLDLVNQILTHTELEAGYHPLILEDVSVPALLEPIRQQLQSGCDSKGLSLNIHLHNDLPAQLRLDAPCIRQAVRALADNALRLTQEGEISLSVRPSAMRGESGLQITIEDDGPGLAPAELKRWQDYFHQAKGTPAYQDLHAPPGMGLALVKAACYSLRGDFLVESKAQGLSVSLVFPATAVVAQTEDDDEQTVDLRSLSAAAVDQRGRILVVEDNAINQRVIKTMLERLQFDVDLADNGERALERLSNNNGQRYQMIFMDCEMPGMDGYTATKRIRQSQWPESICPIIAVTANALHGDRQRCLEAGMNDYMSKPINMQQLRLMISRWSARLPEASASVSAHPSSGKVISNMKLS
ncbi:response regulator [Bacterioplanes sanyensis]|nr:response regulator [Bacterioplanes sanyensis]